jgi:class 3 adenylate cyclase
MEAAPERKLTTILSADVAGYSRLMEADEAGTLARLKAYREVMLAMIAGHRGRLVNTAGDSVLAEFSSVVHAVDCAVRIQRDLAERNATLPQARRMLLRIGVNLGDVMVDGGDLFGEGVNIAARLQELAEPGGVLVSGSVFEQVRNKVSLGFDYLGAQAVKNISEAVPAYRVVLGAGEAAPIGEPAASAAPPVPQPAAPQGRPERPQLQRLKRRAAIAGVAIAALFAINMMTWHGYPWFMWPTLTIVVLFALRSVWVGWQ